MNKKNYLRVLCCTLLLLAMAGKVCAQHVETSIYISGSLPTGQFAKTVDPLASGAFAPLADTSIARGASPALGITGRAGYWFDIGVGEIMPFGEVSFLWNSSKRNIREAFDKAYISGEAAKAPQYFNVPIFGGIKYRYAITDIVMPFLEVGLGLDVLFITGNGFKEALPWYTYKPSCDLAWTVAAGTYLSSHVTLGLYYASFGSHRISYTAKSSGRGDGSVPNHTERRTIGELGLKIGFHF